MKAIAEGFQLLGFKDDHEVNAAQWIVYDALYAYCCRAASGGYRSLAEGDATSQREGGAPRR